MKEHRKHINRYINMYKIKVLLKKNTSLILGILIGILCTTGIAYAAVSGYLFDSDEVYYSNDNSNLTSDNVQGAIDELYAETNSFQLFSSRISTLESQMYPVGSIYISTTKSTTAQVASLFGGKWCAISQGRVLIGVGTGTDSNSTSQSFSINGTGGEYTHKLTISEMPAHTHTVDHTTTDMIATLYDAGNNNYLQIGNVDRATTNSGADYYHNNIQPYLVVYMYKRIENTASC